MQFDNSRFEKNVSQSISTLDKLKQSLDFTSSAKEFDKLEKSANGINFSGLERSIQNIENRFSTMGIVGMNIINKLTDKAIGLVTKLGSATFGKMKTGGISRALNLEHANFMLEGILKDANKVAEIMGADGPVQKSVKGTAYGLDAAANAASQFVASGITDLEKLETALTGISGAAAISGSSYEEISRIFTKVAASGRMMGDTVVELSTRGINALATLSEQLGISVEDLQKMQKKGQISFEMFSEAMNKAFGEQAKKANETFTGALSNVNAALSRIGAKVASPTIENLRVIFVKLIDVIDGASKALQPLIDFINNAFYAISFGVATFLDKTTEINQIISNIVGTIGNAIKTIYSFILPIKRALEDIFPSKTINDAITLTEKIKDFSKTLILTAEQMVTVRRIFRGVFSIFDLAIQVISALIRVLFPAVDGIKGFIGSFANGAATVGDYIYAIAQVCKETDAFYQLFSKIKEYLVSGLGFIGDKLKWVKGLFDSFTGVKFNGGSLIEGFKNLADSFRNNSSPLKTAGNIFVSVFNGIVEIINTVSPLFGSFVGLIGRSLGELANGFEKAFNGGGFRTLMTLIGSGLLVTLAVDLAYFINTIVGTFSRGIGIINSIKSILFQLTNTLKVTQTKIKSEALLNLAKAIGILVASIVALSMLDSGAAARSIAMISLLMGELLLMTYAIEKFSKTWQSNAALLSAAGMFMGLAAAVLILAGAMKQIASIPADKIKDSLTTVSMLLLELTAVALVLGATEAKIKTGAMTLIGLSAAVKILASAMNQIANIPSEKLMDSLGVVTALILELTAVTLALSLTEAKLQTGAIALIGLAASVKILAGAMQVIGSIPSEQITQALIGLSVALVGIAAAAALIGATDFGFFQGGGVLMMAAGLKILAGALTELSTIPDESIGNTIGLFGALVGTLAVFALIGNFVPNMLLTGAALVTMALGINILVPALVAFQAVADSGYTALVALGGALLLMGAAAAAFGAGIEIIGLGALGIAAVSAACLIGAAAIAATAVAIEFISDAFERLGTIDWGTILSGLGKFAVIAISLGAMGALIAPLAITMTILAAAIGMISLACIGLAASITVAAFGVQMMSAAIQSFENISPEAIAKAIDVLNQSILALVNAAWLLAPIAPLLVIIGAGVLALGAGALMAATSLIIFAEAFELLAPMVQEALPAIEEFTTYLQENFTQILTDIWNGLVDFGATITEILNEIIAGVTKLLADLFESVLDGVVDFSADLLKSLGAPKDYIDAGANLIKGFIKGIKDNCKDAIDNVKNLGNDVIEGLKEVLQIHSPSEIADEIGQLFDEGLGNGVSKLGGWVVDKVAEVGKGMIEQAKSDANKVADVWEATIKYYGRSLEFDVGLKNGDIKYVGTGIYMNTKTNEQKNLISGTREAINAINQETKAFDSNTKSGGKNTKAKSENKKANDSKTQAIDEETESLGEEEEAVEDNSDAIREMAEQIEVVTEKYNTLKNATSWFGDKFKIARKSLVLMGDAFHTAFRTMEKDSDGTEKVAKKSVQEIYNIFYGVRKNIKHTTDKVAKGLYAFSAETDKYDKKLTKKLKKGSQSVKKAEKTVLKTGKTIAKVYEGYMKVFTKSGNGVEKMVLRLTKKVKNMASFAREATNFVKNFNMDINKAQYVEDFTDNFRQIEKFFVKRKDMPQKIQNWLGDILTKFKDAGFKNTMNLLGKSIDGVGDYWKSTAQNTAYVADSMTQLAAALYDGSDAANQYWTEIARLEFLVEHNEATLEELEEARRAYLDRAMEALKEYYTTIQDTLGGQFNPFQEFDKKTEDATKDLIGCLESQIAGFQTYGDMLIALAQRGADFNLMKDLADQGVEAYGIIENLVTMTEGQLALYNQYYRQIDSVKQRAADATLAALANARTMASIRAAARSGNLSDKQMKQQKKLAGEMADDMKAVANAVAYGYKDAKKQQKEYMKSLTKEEKKQYKKQLKNAKQAAELEKQQAEAEKKARAQKKAEEERLDSIMKSIKGYESLISVIDKYNNDAAVMEKVNEGLNKSLKSVYKYIDNNQKNTKNWLSFSKILGVDEDAEDADSYFSSLESAITSFMDGLKDALYDFKNIFQKFTESVDKLNMNNMFSNATSQIRATEKFGAYFDQLVKAEYNQDSLNYFIEKFKSDKAGALDEMAALLSGTEAEIKEKRIKFNYVWNRYKEVSEENMKKITQGISDASHEDAQQLYDAAKAEADAAQARVNALLQGSGDYVRQSHAIIEKIRIAASRMSGSGELSNIDRNDPNYGSNLELQYSQITSEFSESLRRIQEIQGGSTEQRLEAIRALFKSNSKFLDAYNYYQNKYADRAEIIESEIRNKERKLESDPHNGLLRMQIDQLKSELQQINDAYANTIGYIYEQAKAEVQSEYDAAVATAQAKSDEANSRKAALEAIVEENKAMDKEAEVLFRYENALYSAQILLTEMGETYENFGKVMEDHKWTQDYITKATQQFRDALIPVSNSIRYATDRFADWGKASGDILINLTRMDEAFLKFASTLDKTNTESSTFMEDLGSRLEEYRKTLDDTIRGQTQLFEEFKKYSGDEPTAATTYLDNMISQTQGLADWLDNLETLAGRGVAKEVVQMFASEGQASYEKVEAFAKASESELAELNKRYADYAKLAAEAADRALAAVASTYTYNAEKMQKDLLESFKERAKSNIEEAAYEAATMVVTGVKDGINKARPQLVAEIDGVATAISSTVAKTLTASEIEESIRKGLNTMSGTLQNSVGVIVTDFLDKVTQTSVSKFKMAVDQCRAYVEKNLPKDYTITIHVDTSEMDAAVARMNYAINGMNYVAVQTSASVAQSQANQSQGNEVTVGAVPTNNTTVNYTQNNYSPTALSRTEIYRQTQNQLQTIRGVVSAS